MTDLVSDPCCSEKCFFLKLANRNSQEKKTTLFVLRKYNNFGPRASSANKTVLRAEKPLNYFLHHMQMMWKWQINSPIVFKIIIAAHTLHSAALLFHYNFAPSKNQMMRNSTGQKKALPMQWHYEKILNKFPGGELRLYCCKWLLSGFPPQIFTDCFALLVSPSSSTSLLQLLTTKKNYFCKI